MKNALKTVLGIFLLATAAVAPSSAQKVKPALKLVKGSTYYNVSSITTTINQTINNNAVSYNVGMGVTMANKVLNKQDTVYNLEVSYQHIDMKMQMSTGTTEYNSDKPGAQDPFSQVLSAILNKPFYVSISTSGKVLSVTGINEVLDAIFKTVNLPDTSQVKQLRAQFSQSFGEKAFKGNLMQTYSIYPTILVAKGDKWQVNSLIESVMTANVQTVYQLQDITPTSYLVHGDGKLASVNTGNTQVNDMPVKYNLTGTIISDITLDKATGWITQDTQKENVTGDFQILDNPTVPGGMTIPMTVNVVSVITDK
jgi:hypothetical protein